MSAPPALRRGRRQCHLGPHLSGIIAKERRGDYLSDGAGRPHVTDAIKNSRARKPTSILCYAKSAAPSATSDRCPSSGDPPAQKRSRARQRHFSPRHAGALYRGGGRAEDKPTQLRARTGVARRSARHIALPLRKPLPDGERAKIAILQRAQRSGNPALDADSIYSVPVNIMARGWTAKSCTPLASAMRASRPVALVRHHGPQATPGGRVSIAVVGKYVGLQDL